MDCRERGSHTQGVYPTQDTSGLGTAGVKQEEEADTRIIAEEYSLKSERKERGNIRGIDANKA